MKRRRRKNVSLNSMDVMMFGNRTSHSHPLLLTNSSNYWIGRSVKSNGVESEDVPC